MSDPKDTLLQENKVMLGKVHVFSSSDTSVQSLHLLARLTVISVDDKQKTVKFRVETGPDPDFAESRCQMDIPQIELPLSIYNEHEDYFEFRLSSAQLRRVFTFRIRKFEKPVPRPWQSLDAAMELNEQLDAENKAPANDSKPSKSGGSRK